MINERRLPSRRVNRRRSGDRRTRPVIPSASRGIPKEVTFKIAQQDPSAGARDDTSSLSVANPFSFRLLVDRLRHFLVESIALSSFRQPLVFRLNKGVALPGEVLNFFLQTISFGT